MGVVRIGQTEVAYELRRTATISERRITVTPGHVEVLALTTDDDATIVAFLNRKRQWLFEAVRGVEKVTAHQPVIPRFMTGSRIPFRGRFVALTVTRIERPHVDISFKGGFVVGLPIWVSSEEADAIVARELKLWLKQRVRRDVREFVSSYQRRFGLQPRVIKVGDLVGGWGSCSAGGSIRINWQLVFAPKSVLDYVVAHELAHLKRRSHDRAFWQFLRQMMPSYERSKAWLDLHQGSLDAAFLETTHRSYASQSYLKASVLS